MRALVLVLLAFAGCEAGPLEGRVCSLDAQCGTELGCVDGRCAPALEDPGGDAAAPGAPVRLISVGLHPTLADVETQETWRAYVRRVFDDEVVPEIAADRPTLVVLPENTALTAAFIGTRGAAGRAATSSTNGLGAVLAAYPDAIGHYAARTSATLAAGRLIGLAVTDTVTRALAVFEALAAEHGVWIAVTTNVGDARRTTDPALIAALVDEAETDRSLAWEAISDDVHNQTLVYGPDGALQHRFRKTYLVPIEESADGLALSFGPLEALRPASLPFARVASVISKDAWMPDVLDRLALEGTQILLQPEAFSGWGIAHGADAAWAPDVVKESGWAQLARDPEIDASVLPCLSQNLFELVFDCQSSVLASERHFDGRAAWIGQRPDAVFAAVAPWSFDEGTGTVDERRARLMTEGARLLPGGDREDGYAAGTVSVDLDPTRSFPLADAHPFEHPLAPSDTGEERRPAIVATSEGFAVFWEDDRRGRTRIYGALGSRMESTITIGAPRVRVATEGEVRAIDAAARGDRVCLVWQEDRDGHRARLSCSSDAGRSFEPAIAIGTSIQWVPDVAIDEDGTVWLAWVDTRDRGAARIFVGRREGDAIVETALEPAPSAYATRENRWAPSLDVAQGRVAVAWTSFAAFAWEIWGAFGGAEGFGAPARLDDASVAFETIHTDPQVRWRTDGGALLVWTDLRVRRPDYDVRARVLDPSSPASSSASAALASTDDAGRPQQRPALALDGEEVIVAWQDLREARSLIRFATSEDAGTSFEADRELLADEVARFHPSLARVGDRWVAAYETTSSGRRRVAITALAP